MNIEELTLGELSEIERMSGQPLAQLGDESFPQMALTAALVTILKRRNGEPKFQLVQALSMTQTQLSAFLEEVGITSDDTEEDEQGKD